MNTKRSYYRCILLLVFFGIITSYSAKTYCVEDVSSVELLELISKGNRHFQQNIQSGRFVVSMTSKDYIHNISTIYSYNVNFRDNDFKCNSESQSYEGLVSNGISIENSKKLNPDHNFIILNNNRVYYTHNSADMIIIEDESFLRGKGYLFYFPFFWTNYVRAMPLYEWISQNSDEITVSVESDLYILEHKNTINGHSIKIFVDPNSGFMISRIESSTPKYAQISTQTLANFGPGLWYPTIIKNTSYKLGKKTFEAIHNIDEFEPNIYIDYSEFSIVNALHPLVTTIADQRFQPHIYYPIKSSEAKISQSELETRLMAAIEKAEVESGIYFPVSKIIFICLGLLILIFISITLVKSRKQGKIAA